jgi:hypothetical protein
MSGHQAELVASYQVGANARELAAQHGIAHTTVLGLLQHHDVRDDRRGQAGQYDAGVTVGSPDTLILALRAKVPEKRTHDYVRHGTTTLFAALEIATCKGTGRCFQRHTTTLLGTTMARLLQSCGVSRVLMPFTSP